MKIHRRLITAYVLVAVICGGFSGAGGVFVVLAHAGLPGISWQAWAQVAGISLLVVLVCLGAACWLVMGVCEPLWELRRRVQNVRKTNPELEVYSFARNEIGELAEEIDALRLQLLNRIREEQRNVKRLLSLSRISSFLDVMSGVRQVCNAALEIAMRELGMKIGAIYLLDEAGGTLDLWAHEGLPAHLPPTARKFPATLGVMGRTIQSGQVLYSDPDAAESWLREVAPNREDLAQIVTIPLGAPSGTLGVMVLGAEEARLVTNEDVAMLTAMGSQIGSAVENARTLERSQRNLRHIQALLNISQEVARNLSLEAVLDMILMQVKQLIGVETCAIFRLDERHGELRIVRSAGLNPDYVARLRVKVGEGSAGRAVSERRPITIADAANDPHFSELEMLVRQEGYYSVLAVPLIGPDKVFGAIEVYSPQRRQFQEDEVQLLSIFANQVAIAIANAELHESSANRLTALNALFETAGFLSASSDAHEIMDVVVNQVSKLFPCNLTYIMLENPSTHELEVVVSRGFSERFKEQEVKRHFIPLRKCWALKKGTHFVVEDDAHDFTCSEIIKEGPARSYACAPLSAGGKTFGVMHMSSDEPHRFTAEDIDLFTTLANQVAISIERAQLFQKVEQLAITDPLTELYNYRYFRERLNESLRRAKRYERPLSLLMMDLDHFKQHNDTFGHPSGDGVLRKVADVLRDVLREVDFPARYGGEEFAVILHDTDKSGAQAVAEKIRTTIEKTAFFGDNSNPVVHRTVSVGVCTFPDDASTDEEIVNEADAALYRAKELGRNRVCVAGEVAELRPLPGQTISEAGEEGAESVDSSIP